SATFIPDIFRDIGFRRPVTCTIGAVPIGAGVTVFIELCAAHSESGWCGGYHVHRNWSLCQGLCIRIVTAFGAGIAARENVSDPLRSGLFRQGGDALCLRVRNPCFAAAEA